MVGGWAGGWVGGWVGGWSPKEVCQGGVWMGCYMKTGLLC
jgi:hypothetical protein